MIPNMKGRSIRFDLSSINCHQLRFLKAKQTPIPDTKNNSGIRHILSMDMGIHRAFIGSSFWIN
jgi:hypothetical protein